MFTWKKATVLIYVLFLVTLSLILATIVLNNFAFLSNTTKFYDIENKLITNIRYDSSILVNINKELNSNGSGFIDNVSCPDSISMSWTTLSGVITNSTLTYSWSIIYCYWSYLSNNLDIYFNTWFTDLIEADYNWFIAAISTWSWDFLDPDLTHIDFSTSSYSTWDLIDDNFNSDNYMWNSTWSIEYPHWFEDDDDLARKIFFWYVSIETWFKKVFWNTTKTLKNINNNSNNTWSLNSKIWDVIDWTLYFDIDKEYEIKIVKFDKIIYDDIWELIAKNIITWSGVTWDLWYLQSDWSLDSSTWSSYIFDFQNNDYAIFLKSTWDSTLLYEINANVLSTWNWIYINPLNDSWTGIIEYLWNEILIDEDWRYMWKEIEIIYDK